MSSEERSGSRSGPRRIRRPADKEQLFKRLVDDEHVFDTYRDLVCFAAVLGCHFDRRHPFEKTLEPMPWEVFRGMPESILQLVAAAGTDDFEILADDRAGDVATAFEEYANGGLSVLQERLGASHRAPLDVVVELIQEADEPARPGELPLDKLAEELTW